MTSLTVTRHKSRPNFQTTNQPVVDIAIDMPQGVVLFKDFALERRKGIRALSHRETVSSGFKFNERTLRKLKCPHMIPKKPIRSRPPTTLEVANEQIINKRTPPSGSAFASQAYRA